MAPSHKRYRMPKAFARISWPTYASNTNVSRQTLPSVPTTTITATTTAPLRMVATEVMASNLLPRLLHQHLRHRVCLERLALLTITPNMRSITPVEVRIRMPRMEATRITWHIMPTISSRLNRLLHQNLHHQGRLLTNHLLRHHQVGVRLLMGATML